MSSFYEIYESLKGHLEAVEDAEFNGELADSILKIGDRKQVAIEMGEFSFAPNGEFNTMGNRLKAERGHIHGETSMTVFVIFATQKRADLFALGDRVLSAIKAWSDDYGRENGLFVSISNTSEAEAPVKEERAIVKQFVVSIDYDSTQFLTNTN